MRTKVFCILIFFFLAVSIPVIGYSNSKQYCEELLRLSENERVKMNYAKALEYLTELKMIAEQNAWFDIKRQSLARMGYVYVEMMDYDKAIDLFIESYEIATTLSDKLGESIALSNISLACHEGGKIEESWKYSKQSYDIIVELNDSLRIAQLAINLASIANIMNNISVSDDFLDIASNMLENKNEEMELIHINLIRIDNYFKQRKYDEAEQLALITFEKLKRIDYEYEKFTKKAYKNIKPDVLILLSAIYEKKKNIDKAIAFAQEALIYNPTLDNQIEIYEQLSVLFKSKHLFDSAFAYKDSVIVKKDSLYKVINSNNLESSRIKFDLLNSEKKLAENKVKQRAERILFIVIITSVLIFSVVSFWVFRLKSIKNKQQKAFELEKERNEKLLLGQQLKEQESLNLLEEERLSNEINEKLLLKQQIREQEMIRILEQERLNKKIESKNKQLIARALSHSDRDKLLKEIIPVLSNISGKTDDSSLDSIIRKLKMQLKDSAEWDNFLVQSEQIDPALFSLLKNDFPNLTANDIHLLSYIYLNLNTKKAAYLLGISAEAYRKKKQRLAAKMGLKIDGLYPFLVNKIKFLND